MFDIINGETQCLSSLSVHKISRAINWVTSFKSWTLNNNVTYLYVARAGKQTQKPNKTTHNHINIL